MPLLHPDDVGPLPPATRLVHIGPHKTGTTALQGAFDVSRPALARQGVHYAGRALQPSAPVTALRGTRPLRGARPGSESGWTDLADEVRRAGDRRVVLSSEYLSDLDDSLVRRVVDDLDARRVHVLVTVRPLTLVAPSQWQQYVQNGHTTAYDRWLDLLLRHPPYERPSPSFWRRHRHDVLVRRWADVVGAERVTVLVVDDTDRDLLPRTVERLLALEPGTLRPPSGRANRGLTRPEIEVVRRLNRTARRESWSGGDYAHVVRDGVVRTLKHHPPDPADRPMASPRWAVEALAETGRAAADALRGSDVRVVGDLDLLSTHPSRRRGGSRLLGIDRAADVVVSAAVSAGAGPIGERPLEDVGTARIAGTLAVRGVARAGHDLRVRAGRRVARLRRRRTT